MNTPTRTRKENGTPSQTYESPLLRYPPSAGSAMHAMTPPAPLMDALIKLRPTGRREAPAITTTAGHSRPKAEGETIRGVSASDRSVITSRHPTAPPASRSDGRSGSLGAASSVPVLSAADTHPRSRPAPCNRQRRAPPSASRLLRAATASVARLQTGRRRRRATAGTPRTRVLLHRRPALSAATTP